MEVNKSFYVETFFVMPNNFEKILSKAACEKLGFIKINGEESKSREMCKTIKTCSNILRNEDRVLQITDKFRDIFEGEGLLKNYE